MIKFSDSKRLLIRFNLNFSDWAYWDHTKSWESFISRPVQPKTFIRSIGIATLVEFSNVNSQISWRTFECFVWFSTAGKNKHIIKKVNVRSQTSLMWTVRPESHARVRIRVEIQVIWFSGTAASRICP